MEEVIIFSEAQKLQRRALLSFILAILYPIIILFAFVFQRIQQISTSAIVLGVLGIIHAFFILLYVGSFVAIPISFILAASTIHRSRKLGLHMPGLGITALIISGLLILGYFFAPFIIRTYSEHTSQQALSKVHPMESTEAVAAVKSLCQKNNLKSIEQCTNKVGTFFETTDCESFSTPSGEVGFSSECTHMYYNSSGEKIARCVDMGSGNPVLCSDLYQAHCTWVNCE